ncbi:MAG: cation:proton antiporter regulatory subunit [Desulfocucumaceae bacterium]
MESSLRKKYGITLLAIRRGKDIIISPGAKELIEENDILIVIGSNDNLKVFETTGEV